MARGRPRLERTPDGEERGTPVDVYVGSRVRMRRSLLGMSQTQLGDSIGLTFQQVQKYEKGANRISASRLHAIAKVLGVPVAFFFEGLGPNGEVPVSVIEKPDDGNDRAPEARRETLELVRNFDRIRNQDARDAIVRLVHSCAAE